MYSQRKSSVAPQNSTSYKKNPSKKLGRGLVKGKTIESYQSSRRGAIQGKYSLLSGKNYSSDNPVPSIPNDNKSGEAVRATECARFYNCLSTYPFFSIHSPISNPWVTEFFNQPFP
jgi:hypothetical protein